MVSILVYCIRMWFQIAIFYILNINLSRHQFPGISTMSHFKILSYGIFLSVLLAWEVTAARRDDQIINKSTKIIGGRKALKNEIPYVVAIGGVIRTKQGSQQGNYCGGSIYNSKFIVSAAHCFHQLHVENLTITAGALSSDAEDDIGQVIGVKTITTHQGFKPANYLNDIAVLELEEELTFNDAVQPIPVAPKGIEAFGKATVSGWGLTEARRDDDDPTPPAADLMTVDVIIVPRPKCDKFYKEILRRELFANYGPKSTARGVAPPPPTSICAGEMPDGGKDSCSGDSGGPLQCTRKVGGKLEKYLCGIVSSGYGCGLKLPGQYTDVAKFHDWIVENTQD